MTCALAVRIPDIIAGVRVVVVAGSSRNSRPTDRSFAVDQLTCALAVRIPGIAAGVRVVVVASGSG